ncbi:hypothetical protein EMIT019CA3_30010 [Bacillus pseudomycoides]|nr:hypothetical protein COF51_28895 [Bacillus pseudomycoides]
MKSSETPPRISTTIMHKNGEGFLDFIEEAFTCLNYMDFFSGLFDSALFFSSLIKNYFSFLCVNNKL